MSQSKNLFAETILKQLGGMRFIAMTGAKNLFFDNDKQFVSMQIMRNQAKAKWVKITLNCMDLYDMEFVSMKGNELVTVAERKGLYNDMLPAAFTAVTGLNTHL